MMGAFVKANLAPYFDFIYNLANVGNTGRDLLRNLPLLRILHFPFQSEYSVFRVEIKCPACRARSR
jgi:hypothetical protein